MESYQQYFENKKITLMGLGLLGRGVGDARFLAECGAEVLVTDMKDEHELAESVAELERYDNISFVLGEHREEDFRNADLVLKAAGVPLDSPYIEAAHEAGVPVTMSTALFAELSPATLVGVTGTRGKSTTTHLIAHILKQAHSTGSGQADKNVFLGGNVKGVSTLEHLPESSEDEIAVLELDSWQLQGFGDAGISPHIAVFTSFMADHMDYYKGDMDQYLKDKAQIFLHQNADDVCITTEAVKERLDRAGYVIPSQLLMPESSEVSDEWQERLPGEHNRANIALAAEAARQFHVTNEVIDESIRTFGGVEGRLQYIGDVHGAAVYNDTTATTPDATVAALRALNSKFEIRNSKQIVNSNESKNKHIVLIAGGSDKGLDVDQLAEEIERHCKAVVWLPGSGTDSIKGHVSRIKGVDVFDVDGVEDAVAKAFEIANEGDTVVLSPAFASFNMFDNEFDRGEQFVRAVKKLHI